MALPSSTNLIRLSAFLLLVPVSGCLVGPSMPPPIIDSVLTDLNGYALVCVPHAGPAINASTGRVDNVCDAPVATGPRPVNEPSIAVNPKDPKHLVAGGNDYNLGSGVWAGVYVTRDGGSTWSQGWIPGYPGGPTSTLSGSNSAGDPAIAFAQDGTVYYAGIASVRTAAGGTTGLVGGASASGERSWSLFIARSRDGGFTWDNVAVAQQGIGGDGALITPLRAAGAEAELLQDKEYIAVGPDGTVYVTWTAYQLLTAVAKAPIQLIRSTDQGATWSDPVVLSRLDDNQGSVPVVAADGTLTVTWAEFPAADESALNIVARTSRDGGKTFGDTIVVAKAKSIAPTHHTRDNSFPSSAVDRTDTPSRGRITTVWASNETGDADVFLSQSVDQGATWTAPVRVNQDPVGNGRDQFFPWPAVAPDGSVHVVYFDGRDDPRNQQLAVYVASTFDGHPIVERAVTDAPFFADQDGFSGDNFLGDYLGIAASDFGVFPIWPDSRVATNGLGDLDLFTARLTHPPASG